MNIDGRLKKLWEFNHSRKTTEKEKKIQLQKYYEINKKSIRLKQKKYYQKNKEKKEAM